MIIACAADCKKGFFWDLEKKVLEEGIDFLWERISPFSWAAMIEWERDHKREDIPVPVLVTISQLTEEQMDKDTGEMKRAMHFLEYDKPLALNSTNIQIAAKALGSDETEDWIGKKLVLYTDPNVSVGGKIVGGLRLRAAKNQPKPALSQEARPG